MPAWCLPSAAAGLVFELWFFLLLQYLTKKYLKRQQLRDFLRVVAPTKTSYAVRCGQLCFAVPTSSWHTCEFPHLTSLHSQTSLP
jgi:hypothetical protein